MGAPMMRTAAPATPWQESIQLRRTWRDEARAAGRPSVDDWRPDEVSMWFGELQAEIDRYALATGHPELVPGFDIRSDLQGAADVDPREALVRLIAVAGAAIDAMGRD